MQSSHSRNESTVSRSPSSLEAAPTVKSRIRLLCVDDHRIVREGIELIINRQPDMHVVGSVASGHEALEQYKVLRPDITLMDLQLGAISGVEAIRQIRSVDEGARVVVLTMYQGDEDIYRALEAGAVTYLLKDTLSEDLINVVREVHAGGIPSFSPDVQARLNARAAHQHLTPREIQVIELIARGHRNKEIAGDLGISEETAQVHVRNILGKLKVQDRTAAIRVALQRGIIHITQ
jgi:DNA-binding NarL/FixJ family response regulator